jgi:hypothetical protein
MRLVLATCLMIGLALSSPPARAADLSGVWTVDQAAWRQQLDSVIGAMLARMPPEMVAQLKAQGVDPARALRESATEGVEGTVEFLPGGTLRSVSRAEGPREDGRWRFDGDRLRVEVEDAQGLESLVGEVAGDRITLRPILADPDADNAFLGELTYPLLRRR